MSRRQHAIVLWTALFGWACSILWLSSLSPDELPEAAFAFWDKFNHFAAFAIGGWLAAAALRVSRPDLGRPAVLILAVILVAAFGLLDEWLQTITPGRTGANIYDWIADALGAVAGALLRVSTLSFRRNSKEPR